MNSNLSVNSILGNIHTYPKRIAFSVVQEGSGGDGEVPPLPPPTLRGIYPTYISETGNQFNNMRNNYGLEEEGRGGGDLIQELAWVISPIQAVGPVIHHNLHSKYRIDIK